MPVTKRRAKLSIIIASFNEEKRIVPCLQYLAAQTVPPEVIFVDGGSKDRTVEIIKDWAEKYPNLKVILEQGEKRSVANALNCGWKKATGDVVLLTAVDTGISPDFTEKVEREFAKHLEYNVIRFRCKPCFPPNFNSMLEKAMFYKDERGEGKLILFRTDMYKRHGFYDANLGFGDDRVFWRDMLRGEKILDVDTTVQLSKSATLDWTGIRKRYIWYGRTIPKYLSKKFKDNDMDYGILAGYALSIAFVLSIILSPVLYWLNPVFLAAPLVLALIPFLRGVKFGIRLYTMFKETTPLLVLPFTEVYGLFFVGVGFFKRALGDLTIGR